MPRARAATLVAAVTLLLGCNDPAVPAGPGDAGASEDAADAVTLRLSRDRVDFGSTPCGTQAASQEVELTSRSSAAAVAWTARLEKGTDSSYSIEPAQGEIVAGGRATLTLIPKALSGADPLDLSDVLVVETAGAPALRVAVTQEALGARLATAPQEIDVGEVVAGKNVQRVATLANRGSSAATVALTPEGLSIVGDAGSLVLAPQSAVGVTLSLGVGDAGTRSGALRFTTSDRLCGVAPPPVVFRATGVAYLVGDVALGEAFSCARAAQDRVACWGAADRGQMGVRLTGTSAIAPLPQPVPGVASPLRLAAGAQHACALGRDGTVSCWGSNSFGQLARASDGTVASGSIDAVKGATSIAAGATHACAVRAGEVFCWGDNVRGQVGVAPMGATPVVRAPIKVAGITDAIAVAAGGQHTCALRASGDVICWGSNIANVVDGDASIPDWRPPVAAGITDATAIAVGGGHVCAVKRSGAVACWGKNDRGQLGRSSMSASPIATPEPVQALDDAVMVAAGSAFTCALKRSGKVACWGDNGSLQLGLSGRSAATSPEIVPGVDGADALAAGALHACARVEQRLVCWGFNTSAQLGTGAVGAPGLPARAYPL